MVSFAGECYLTYIKPCMMIEQSCIKEYNDTTERVIIERIILKVQRNPTNQHKCQCPHQAHVRLDGFANIIHRDSFGIISTLQQWRIHTQLMEKGDILQDYIKKRAMSTTQDICWLSESYPVLMLGMLPNKEGKMNLEK